MNLILKGKALYFSTGIFSRQYSNIEWVEEILETKYSEMSIYTKTLDNE